MGKDGSMQGPSVRARVFGDVLGALSVLQWRETSDHHSMRSENGLRNNGTM